MYIHVVLFFILCNLISLTGKIPFNGKSYKEIVYKNMKAKIDFSLPQKMKIAKDTLNLLKAMLEKNPKNRITASEAINHPCFHKMLSISPLIIRPSFNARSLLDHEKVTKKTTQKVDMPNRIEDMSPSPLPQDRNRSPMLMRYKNNFQK